MHKDKYSKLVAAISISLLLISVLFGPIKSVYADSTKEEIQKQKEIAEQQAEAYLSQFGTKSNYGQLNAASTNEYGMDRNVRMAQAQAAIEEKAQQYLRSIATPSHIEVGAASTNEFGSDRNAELAKAQQALEEITQKYVQMQQSNYGWFNATTTDESGSNRNVKLAQAQSALEEKNQQYLEQINKTDYTQIKATGTDLSGLVDKKSYITQAEQTLEDQAQQYLQQIAKPNHDHPPSVSTDESGKNRKDEIAQAQQALEEKDKALIAQMYPKLSNKNYGGS